MPNFLSKISIAAFALILLAMPVFAQSVDNPLLLQRLQDLAGIIAAAMQAIGGAVGVIMILVAAFYYMTASGDAEKIKTAHRLILWAVVGLAVLLIGRGWVAITCSILGC